MDKTGKFGVALAVIVLLGWQFYYSKQMEQARLAQPQAAPAAEIAAPGAGPAGGAQTPAPASAPAAPAVATGAGPKVQEVLRDGDVEWVLSSVGGGVERVNLLKHQAEGGHPVVLNEFGGIPIGALTEGFEAAVLEGFDVSVAADRRSVTFRRTDVRQFVVEKRYSLPAPVEGKPGSSEFQLELEVRFLNQGTAPVTIPSYAARAGSAVALHVKDQPTYTGFNRSKGGESKFLHVGWFSGSGLLGFGKTPDVYADSGKIEWVGVTNQYYSTILSPRGEAAADALARRFPVAREQWVGGGRALDSAEAPQAVDGALRYGAAVLEPGKELVRKLHIFAGPREHWRLQQLGAGQEQMLDFGWFGLVSRALLGSMNLLNGVLGSYAAAIIVLTIIIKLLMWPLQNKSTASMKRMQELQPKMTALREKYANDPQRLNVEMMGLYKKHGVNPLAGCLPMLVQIPIFFGFFNMLGKAVELRNSPFLWVKDLSQPDTVAFVAGFPVNVLPILMAVTMVGQMQLTPKTGDPVQQRIFMFMPLMFVAFCYNYASGLALYWTVQNIFTIIQLLITNRNNKRDLPSAAAGGKR